MKNNRIIILVLLVFLLSFRSAMAAGVGTTGAAFLEINGSASAAGMGEAVTGYSQEIGSIYTNPAGLTTVKGMEASLMHMEWFQSIRSEYVSFARPFPGLGVIGGSVSLLYLTMDKTTEKAYDSANDTTCSAYDMLVNLSWANKFDKLLKNLSIGGNFKFIRETIDVYNANTLAIDMGGTYWFDWGLSLGVVCQNMGLPIKFVEKGDPLPFTFKVGAAYNKLMEGLNITTDINVPLSYKLNVRFGAEYWLIEAIAIRAGYKTETDLGSLSGLSAGLAFRISDFQLDYAFVPYGDMGLTHRFSVMWRGPEIKEQENIIIIQRTKEDALKSIEKAEAELAKAKSVGAESLSREECDQATKLIEQAKTELDAENFLNACNAADSGLSTAVTAYQKTTAVSSTADAENQIKFAKDVKAEKYTPDKLNSAIALLDKAKQGVALQQFESAVIDARSAGAAALEAANEAIKKGVQEVAEALHGENLTVKAVGKTIRVEIPLNFNLGEKELTTEMKITIQKVADIIKKDYADRQILITGHTDNKPVISAKFKDNKELSVLRALYVQRALAEMGIDVNHLYIQGYGEEKPVADNSTEEGRAKNRRVEIDILGQ